jgi:hypothetical protein
VTGCGQKCAVKRHFPIAMLEGPVALSPDDANPQTNGADGWSAPLEPDRILKPTTMIGRKCW